MNPIEHLWDHLYRQIRARHQPPVNKQELQQPLRDEWQRIPVHVIRRLTSSMRRRITACIEAAEAIHAIEGNCVDNERVVCLTMF